MVKNKVDPCMLCGEAPCACFTVSKPQPKKRIEPPEPVTVVEVESQLLPEVPKRSFRDAMRSAASQAPPPQPAARPKPIAPPRIKVEVNEQEALFAAAVRALGPLLRYDEQEKYRAILTSSPSIEERRVVWRARRRYELEEASSDAGDATGGQG